MQAIRSTKNLNLIPRAEGVYSHTGGQRVVKEAVELLAHLNHNR